MTILAAFMDIMIMVLSVLMGFVAFELIFNKSDKYTEVKHLIEDMISQNSFLCENINNLAYSVDNLHSDVETIKQRNEELSSQIEKVRDILKDIIKSK